MTKNTSSLSSSEVKALVGQLFDNDIENLPEEFNQIDPTAFYKEVLKQKKALGWSSKITIPCNYAIDGGEMVLKKIEEVRQKMSGEKFDEFWNCFEASLDISVWGSDTWAPRVLPNGAVLIRNHHRVIALSDNIAGELDIDNEALHKDLEEVVNFAKNNSTGDDDYFNFHFVHRNEEGISWTVNLPTALSDYGQTLVFINKNFIDQARDSGEVSPDNIIFNDAIEQVADQSRSGHCVLRVFKNRTFLYYTYRADDGYDSILENYSYWLGSSPDEDINYERFSVDHNFVRDYVSGTIQDQGDIEILDTNTMKHGHNVLQILLKDKIFKDYSSKKAHQISEFQPIFASAWDRPTTYYQDKIPFWDFSEKYQHRVFGIKGDLNLLPSLSEGKATFKEYLKEAVGYVGNATVKIWLPTNVSASTDWIDDEDVFEYGSKECNKRIDEIMKTLEKKYKETLEDWKEVEDPQEREKNFLEYYGYEYYFAILFITNEVLPTQEYHRHGLNISRVFDGSISLFVPAYGYLQGYCAGELDTGNAFSFIMEDEEEPEEDDDEYYDEDEDNEDDDE